MLKSHGVQVTGGYLNISINQRLLAQQVLQEIEEKQEQYGSSNRGNGKNVIVEYSSPNIAKPFHIGHLRNTIIGSSLYKVYQFLGYHTIGINHLGDYGTQFAKLIEGYKRWGAEYNIDENPIEELTKIYVRISDLCKMFYKCVVRILKNSKKAIPIVWNYGRNLEKLV